MQTTTTKVKKFSMYLTSFLVCIIFSTHSALANEKEAITLSFGVYQADKASEVHKKFNPLINYLSTEVTRISGINTLINLRIFKSYKEANNALTSGQVDFARFGPASYIIAKEKQPKIRLLAMEEKKGESRFKGLIIVKKDSPLKNLSDLKHKSFAFGDINSTIGRYLAQSELLSAGIDSTSLSNYKFLGRHDKVFNSVEIGDFDAGSVKESTYNKMNKSNQLRILHSFDNVTKPWISRAGLPKRILGCFSFAMI